MMISLATENLAVPGIRHGFFTRAGGVSTGIYASLNCGPGSGDSAEAVAENRLRVARHLGANADQLMTPWQVHGSVALPIAEPWPDAATRPRADALVTASPGLVVGVLTADCAPVLFADPVARVVAAAHAGWKGALGGIIESTIVEMERLGADRRRILAAIGPCIGPQAYEVGPEFKTAFLSADTQFGSYFTPGAGDKSWFDLPGFVASRLHHAGIAAASDLGACTYSDESRFFSFRRVTHRKEADYGRQIAAIVAQ